MKKRWTWKYCAAVIAVHVAAFGSVRAETDLSGEWAPRYHEDLLERIPGPALGEYHGIPINDAGRRRAESWSASILSVIEHQCVPHPADYATRGPSHLRIWKEIDRSTQQLVAIRLRISVWGAERTIWMDGRAHPPPYAAHTWQGFSTGVWNGNVLTVTTTHLKPAFLRRNGVPRSEGAVLREHFIRHGNDLTHISVIDDPAYLTEPFIRSQNWVLSPYQVIAPYPCDPAEEGAMPRHAVPHYLPGRNPHLREYAEKYDLPLEGTMGGAGTMYPEFIEGKDRPGVAGAPIVGSPAALGRPVNLQYVQGNVYMLHTPGGNVTVQAGDEGLVIVDTLGAELADAIYAAIAPLSAGPIRYIVNTHAHESRTGGNGALAARGRSIIGGNVVTGVDQDALRATARIVAHENVLLSMTSANPPRAFQDWPTDVFYTDRRDLFFNGEGVQVSHAPAAGANGDSLVYFRRSDVISTGDIFRTDAFPFIDLEAGGSIQGVIDGLNAIIDLAIPALLQEGGTMIVPGRGRLADESDVVDYRDMVVIVRDRIKDGLDKGLSLQQVQATRPTLGYDWPYGRSDDGWTGEDFVAVVYRDLSGAR